VEGVEGESDAARVEASGGDRGVDLGEGGLHGAAIFEDREPEGIYGLPGRQGGGEAVKAVVEVAVGLVSQSHGLTPGSGGQDVAALVRDDRHGTLPTPASPHP